MPRCSQTTLKRPQTHKNGKNPLDSRFKRSSVSPSEADKHPEWARDWPTIMDRFKLHAGLMDSIKDNEKIKEKMDKRDHQMLKLNKKMKL